MRILQQIPNHAHKEVQRKGKKEKRFKFTSSLNPFHILMLCKTGTMQSK
jgi:hypothetical protein